LATLHHRGKVKCGHCKGSARLMRTKGSGREEEGEKVFGIKNFMVYNPNCGEIFVFQLQTRDSPE